MEIRIHRLSPTFKKREDPACCSCGYDAEWLLMLAGIEHLGTLERMFCERCLTNAMLDAVNFNCAIPNGL